MHACMNYVTQRSRVRVSGPAGIVGGGSECPVPSIPWLRWDTVEQGTEPPTAPRAPLNKWLPTAPGVCSLCVFVHYSLLCVCALRWVKCRAQIPSMGHHTWPHVMSFPSFLSLLIIIKYWLIDLDTHLWRSAHLGCTNWVGHTSWLWFGGQGIYKY